MDNKAIASRLLKIAKELVASNVKESPLTSVGESLLDNAIGKYSNPPARNKAVYIQFDTDPRGGLLEIRKLPKMKTLKPEQKVHGGMASTAKHTWTWKKGTTWGEVIDAIIN